MAFYRGRVNKISLIDKILQLLTVAPVGATSAYWKQVQSGTYAQEGYILYSKGSSGTDDIYIRLKNVDPYSLYVSLIEKYTPNSVSGLEGIAENESIRQSVSFSSVSLADSIPIDYILSFDRDKIMIALKAGSSISSRQTLMWVGLPERLDPNDTSKAAVIAVSRNGYQLTNYGSDANSIAGYCRVLEARNKEKQALLQMLTLTNAKTKGWGDKVLLSHIYLQSPNNLEGVRSRMTSIHPIIQVASTPDFRDGDEITVGSKRYVVLDVWDNTTGNAGTNCFTQKFMAIEQL